MIPFIVLVFVPVFIQHIVLGRKNIDFEKKNKISMLFFFVLLTILIMLRHENVGNDTRNYINTFKYISEVNWRSVNEYSVEMGFSYFNKIISLFTDNSQVYIAVSAIITVMMIYPTYKRLCKDPSLSIVIFCTMPTFVMMFSGIRQMLAIGIGCIAYEFTRNKKLIPFVISVCIAMTFHISAFMLAFMYPIYHAKITKKWLGAVVPVLLAIFVFNKQIFSFLTMLLRRFTRFDAEVTSTGAFTILLLFVIFAIFAFLIPDESRLDKDTIGLRNFLLFSIIIQMFAPLHMLAMRMNYYYIIFIPLLIPKVIACKSEKWNQLAITGRHTMVVFFLMYFFLNANSISGNLNVFPYHFFWEVIR